MSDGGERRSRLGRSLAFVARGCLIAAVVVAAAAYVLLSPRVAAALFGDQLFFPHPPGEGYDVEELAGVPRKDVTFANGEGANLHGWLFSIPHARAGKPPKVVLICHRNAGNIGHRLHTVKALIDGGASVFVFDYRGFGRSEGKPSLEGVCADGEAAYRFLIDSLGVPPAQIVLFGESIGGGVASKIAAKNPVAGVILSDTFTSLIAVGQVKVPALRLYPRWLAPDPPLDNLAYVSGRHAPLLIIHGRLDRIIPVDEALALYRSASAPKQLVLLEHSGHNDRGADWNVYSGGIAAFLSGLR